MFISLGIGVRSKRGQKMGHSSAFLADFHGNRSPPFRGCKSGQTGVKMVTFGHKCPLSGGNSQKWHFSSNTGIKTVLIMKVQKWSKWVISGKIVIFVKKGHF